MLETRVGNRTSQQSCLDEFLYSRVVSSATFAGYRLGYARVSTLEQDPVLQHDALTAAATWCAVVLDAAEALLPWELRRINRSIRDAV